MNATPLLEFRTASVGYGDTAVVSRAELAVAGGEFVGLVGPNGAGKSTMLRAVTGGARVLAGSVLAGGRDVGAMTDRERARLIAVLPQALPTAFSFSARQFVEMGRHPHLGRFDPLGPHDAEAVDRAMELTDTARLSAEPVDALSGGDLQRLVLAQALAQEPRVLLLDEPTSHLDLDHRLQVLDLVRDLADEGTAVVAVFHDLDLAARYSDRLAVVHAGALGPVGPPTEVLTAELVARVFAVRAVVGIDPVTGSVSVTPVLRDAAVASSRAGRVLVVSGSGSGASLMRALVSAGWRVAAAALNQGDTDHGVASTLGLERVDLPAFGEMDAAAEDAVAALAAAADAVVVADVPFGRTNVGNLRAAARSGRPLVLVGEMASERDFTGGEAAELWDDALRSGAARVPDAAGAVEAVEGLLGGEGEA